MPPKRAAFAAEDIGRSRTKARSPQTRGTSRKPFGFRQSEAACRCGVAERFHKAMLHEFHHAAFRKRICTETAPPQADLDAWMASRNEQRPRQGRWCRGKTPMQTFVDSKPVAKDKMLSAARRRTATPHPTPNRPSVGSGSG